MKKNNQQSVQESHLGKIQPQALELEEAVLGAIMLEKEAYPMIENILSADDFYHEANKKVYQAIANLSSKRYPIDMLTVIEELKRIGELEVVGGPVFVSQLTDKVASSAHLVYHARIVYQKSMARKIIANTSKIQAMAYDESNDVDEVLEEYEKTFSDITTKTAGFQSISMNDALKLAINRAEQAQADRNSGKLTAIPTHLHKLDEVLEGGWRSPDLIILGGRPSMGKTQHALAIASAAANANVDCLFVSIEMNTIQLVNRYILEDERIKSYNLRTGQMSDEEWRSLDEQCGILSNIALHIADNHNIRYLNNIKSEARRLHRQGKLKLLIIDYLQLIKTNMRFERRQLEVAHITGELKSLAKELNIPIIALSQLSRPQKGLKPKEPDLEDLREAGDIEQDADIVMFIHKPDYYDKDETEWKNKGMLIIRKSREGVRNEAVKFCHDNRYKKIFDEGYNNKPQEYYTPAPLPSSAELEASFGQDNSPF